MAAAAVSILELPLSATIITLLLTSKAGIATAPLIIVAVVVAYLTIKTLTPAPGRRAPAPPAASPGPPHPRTPPQPQTQATVRHDHRALFHGQRLVRCAPGPGQLSADRRGTGPAQDHDQLRKGHLSAV